jgi:hypothetical protein
MADEPVKKVIIPIAELPGSSPIADGYLVRFRIVSEDKNRVSHWSPIYVVREIPTS